MLDTAIQRLKDKRNERREEEREDQAIQTCEQLEQLFDAAWEEDPEQLRDLRVNSEYVKHFDGYSETGMNHVSGRKEPTATALHLVGTHSARELTRVLRRAINRRIPLDSPPMYDFLARVEKFNAGTIFRIISEHPDIGIEHRERFRRRAEQCEESQQRKKKPRAQRKSGWEQGR